MKYTQKSFTVASGGTKEYRDSWDLIFGKKTPETPPEVDPGLKWYCSDCNLEGEGWTPKEHAAHLWTMSSALPVEK